LELPLQHTQKQRSERTPNGLLVASCQLPVVRPTVAIKQCQCKRKRLSSGLDLAGSVGAGRFLFAKYFQAYLRLSPTTNTRWPRESTRRARRGPWTAPKLQQSTWRPLIVPQLRRSLSTEPGFEGVLRGASGLATASSALCAQAHSALHASQRFYPKDARKVFE